MICPSPHICGVKTHRAGSQAARNCSSFVARRGVFGTYVSERDERYVGDAHVVEYRSDLGHGRSVLHRTDGPAVVVDNSDGDHHEVWFQGDVMHREDGPAQTSCTSDGIRIEEWQNFGERHRIDGPAVTITDCGEVTTELWYRFGELHRDKDEPASRVVVNGDLTEQFWRAGKHRTSIPWCVTHHRDGRVTEKWERYARDGTERPVRVTINPDGARIEEWSQPEPASPLPPSEHEKWVALLADM